jgi:hypothetical protein
MKSIPESGLKSLPVTTVPIREVHVDIEARDLIPAAAGMDFVIVRVCGLAGPSGRPVSRSLRIPASLLAEQPSFEEPW